MGPAELRETAARAAETGGRIVRESVGRGRAAPAVADKDLPGDYVTEVDLASERAIREVLGAATPGWPVLGEEGGESDEVGDVGSDRYWLVDPLDGTTNFVHGFWAVGVSVALVEGGRPVAGAVHAPFLDVMWTASRGGGASRAGGGGASRAGGGGASSEPIRVATGPPGRAVVATGFPFRRKKLVPRYLRAFHAAFERFEDLRRPGAAALDLAWVADGTFDGFFELSLGPWDVAAGALLIEEAGGVVTDWSGGPGYLGGDILAGGSAVHAELLQIARLDREATSER